MAFFSSPVLAHGALGAYDDIIFVAVAIAFVAIMALSWWKSRDLAAADDASSGEPAPSDTSAPAQADAPDRFPL